MNTYKLGLVVGRFQPFHKGHEYLIKQALKHCEKLIIAVGSSNKKNTDNPFRYFKRKGMLHSFIEHENLDKRIVKIIASPDVPDDYAWRDALLRKTGKVDVVIGNNDEGSNRFFEEAGIPIIRVPFYKREEYEGKKIRELMKKGMEWQTRIPSYIYRSFFNNR